MNPSSRTIQFLILITIFLFIQLDIAYAFATDNLMENGDFETGDLRGWDTVGFSEVRQYNTSDIQEQTGNFYAIIGSSNPNIKIKNTISQSFRVSKNEIANISFMYKVENKSTLDVYLKQKDGSVVNHWKFYEPTPWTILHYQLDQNYSEKTLTLVFEGKGFNRMLNKSNCPIDPTKEEPDQGCGEGFFRVYYYPNIDGVKIIPIIASENNVNTLEPIIESEIHSSTKTAPTYTQTQNVSSTSSQKFNISPLLIQLIIIISIVISVVYLFKRKNT